MSSKIFDDFQEMFHDESEFIDSIRDMETTASGSPKSLAKSFRSFLWMGRCS